jgi:predicted HicB family RNase H-like nuclease
MKTEKQKYPSDDLNRFIVRMPERLHRKLQEKAKEEKRSMNSQALKIFEDALDKKAA